MMSSHTGLNSDENMDKSGDYDIPTKKNCPGVEMLKKMSVNFKGMDNEDDGSPSLAKKTPIVIETLKELKTKPVLHKCESSVIPSDCHSGSWQDAFQDTLHNLIVKRSFNMDERLLKNIINEKDKNGSYLLHHVVFADFKDAAKKLLDLGADPYAFDNTGRAPIHLCKNVEMAKLLKTYNVDLHAKTKDGKMLLLLAYKSKNLDLCEFLLENKDHFEHLKEYFQIPHNWSKKQLFLEMLYGEDLEECVPEEEWNLAGKDDDF